MRLETERLILRQWEERDRAPLAEIFGDPEVRRFYPRVLTPEESSATMRPLHRPCRRTTALVFRRPS